MEEVFKVDICGRTEELPVLRLPSGIKIAFFNLHGNQELTEYCAKRLVPLIENAEVIITAESKGLQLAHCVAREVGHKLYAVARKSRKLYMQDGISVSVQSITTGVIQTLYLSNHDVELIRGKRVAIVDDVISTGGSILSMEQLVEKAGGIIAAKCAVLAEGEACKRTDVKYLATIPLL